LVAHGIQLLCSMNMCKKRFHSYFVRWWILEWSRCCCWFSNISRSCKTAVPGLGVERKSQQQQEVCEKAQLTFIVAMYSWCERLKKLFILDSELLINCGSFESRVCTKKDSGSKSTWWRSGDACGTLLRRWNFLQTSAIWITQVIGSAACFRTLKLVPMPRAS
jgi:hypothetical protein